MNAINQPSSRGRASVDPLVLGTAFCIISALGYTGTNICLRFLAGHANQVLVIWVKELVTVAVVGPWLAYLTWQGMHVWPRARALVPLVLVGLATQLVANLGVIWALGVVGLAVTIPAALGVSLAASAILGRLFLGERVSTQSAMAVALLIASIVLLKMGADQGSLAVRAGPFKAAIAVGVACLAGLTYAMLTVVIRRSVTKDVSTKAVVFIVTGMGVLVLGPLSLWQLGVQGALDTPGDDLAIMLLAGALNLIAFLAITKGLQLTTIVRVNVLNASQVAMAAVAGMLFFAEEPSVQLILGICLTIAGTLLIDRADGRPANTAQPSSDHADEVL